jgi:hypothetical protein
LAKLRRQPPKDEHKLKLEVSTKQNIIEKYTYWIVGFKKLEVSMEKYGADHESL